MKKNKATQNLSEIPKELQEKAKGIIREAFDLFANHIKRMAKDLEDFNKESNEIEEKIRDGARRTKGRIV